MRRSSWLKALGLLVSTLVVVAGFAAGINRGGSSSALYEGRQSQEGDADPAEELFAEMDWFYGQRMAPGTRIPGVAREAALLQARALAKKFESTSAGLQSRSVRAATAGSWTNLGPQPLNAGNIAYNDPSNGSVYPNGFHNVSGRVTALAVAPGHPNTVYLGGADGGVWRTTNGGASWKPIGDHLDTTSIGSIAIAPRAPKRMFVGTGEANTNGDSYFGAGIFKSIDAGAHFTKVGGNTFYQATVFRLYVAGRGIHLVLAATNHGLFRSTDGGSSWTRVLAPGGNTDPFGNFISDVAPLYQNSGKSFLAVAGWRGGDASNGLYRSDDGGATWTAVNPTGFPPQGNIGRVSLGTTKAQPGLVYAVVQDAQLLNQGAPGTVLNGIYKSTSGPEGPWTMVANSGTFASDPDSALQPQKVGQAYAPGVQSWYNQYVIIDPLNANDVFVGLEEIYNTSDGGQTWHTVGRYWNVCASNPGPPGCNQDPNQHPTTHPDQHAAAFTVVNGQPKIYVGSDGGAWSQVGPTWSNDHWTDLNTNLSITQPYYAAASNGPDPVIYAGAQDNGTDKYSGAAKWDQIFGGDGADVAVDPANPNHAIEEYVYLQMYKTEDGGAATNDPSCDPNLNQDACAWQYFGPPDAGSSSTARFIAPFAIDPLNVNHFVALGENVWESTKGFDTVCDNTTCDWNSSYDNGSGHVGTALAVFGQRIYEGWCGPCNPTPNIVDPNGTGFGRGLATNVGGTWHVVKSTSAGCSSGCLPNRYITSIAIDPTNVSHVFVTASGFSRRWVPGAGTGHVFESTDGGQHFTNISGDLPDIPTDSIIYVNGQVIVGTDVGVFTLVSPGSWAPLGTGLPNVEVNDLRMIPNTDTLMAITHGRGVWTIPLG